ncbi:MAG: hypothetical protein IT342_18620 [Candidatus Melainabacteria bacterium]|nr:hypothetical protein [Candidatus Melainabacteria bacterium]
MYDKLTKSLIIAFCLCLGAGQFGSRIPVGADEAKPANDGFDKPYGYYLKPILEAVKANDDQRKKITQIVEDLRPTIEPLRKKFREKQSMFLSGMAKGISAEDLLCAQSELGQIRGEINDQYLLMRLRVRKLLQPAQIVAYDDFLAHKGWIKKQPAR